MIPIRIIPRLDIKGPNLVKGVHLEGLRVLGKPYAFAEHYYRSGADELMFQDVVATLYERNNLLDLIRETAQRIFIPLCVGGGIRTMEDIKNVLRAGADKVAVNTQAIRDPDFVHRASRRFGASTIVVSIEAVKMAGGRYEALTDNGRERTGLDAVDWAERVADMGAGELLITSIDREGTGAGFDEELTAQVASRVPVPVIALGGCGDVSHALSVATATQVSAVSCASVFHYDALAKIEQGLDGFDERINLEVMSQRRVNTRISPCSINGLRRALRENGVTVRAAGEA